MVSKNLLEASINIKGNELIILMTASNLETMRASGQGLKMKDLVKATLEISKMLKEELGKADFGEAEND